MLGSGIRQDYPALKALSLDHAMVHRKTILEQTRAFPEICGYNITGIRDIPIATSGLFDDQMRPKFDPDIFRQTNDERCLVPAWDLTREWIDGDRVRNRERYNFYAGDPFGLHILFSNWGASVENGTLSWDLTAGEESLRRGSMEVRGSFAAGKQVEVGYLRLDLPRADAPMNCVLTVRFTWRGGECRNQWPVFLYPRQEAPAGNFRLYDPCNLFTGVEKLLPVSELEEGEPVPPETDVVITSLLTKPMEAYLVRGGRVFLMQRGKGVLPTRPSAFWREGMTKAWKHPFWNGLSRTHWMEDLRYFGVSTTTSFRPEAMEGWKTEPILRRYDCRAWHASDYIMAFAKGEGRGIATTLRLEGGLGKEPMFVSGNPFSAWMIRRALEMLREKGNAD